tara:strand:- start:130 stop:360 length:231 start_codon:yes stop_codon:yes gene_type:complete
MCENLRFKSKFNLQTVNFDTNGVATPSSDIENHASYVNSWKQHLKPSDIMKATNNAAKAFHFLLDSAEQMNQDMAA